MALNTFQFALLVIATLSIAAAGNVINDIHDVKADAINKPTKVIVGENFFTYANPHLYQIIRLLMFYLYIDIYHHAKF